MAEVSRALIDNARKIESHLLRLRDEMTQTKLASLIGCDASAMSRYFSSDGGLRRAAEVIAALGLRLKDASEPDFDEEYVYSLETLARVQLDKRAANRRGR